MTSGGLPDEFWSVQNPSGGRTVRQRSVLKRSGMPSWKLSIAGTRVTKWPGAWRMGEPEFVSRLCQIQSTQGLVNGSPWLAGQVCQGKTSQRAISSLGYAPNGRTIDQIAGRDSERTLQFQASEPSQAEKRMVGRRSSSGAKCL